MHRSTAIAREVSENLVGCLDQLDESVIERFIDELAGARGIFILGLGHSGLIGRILVMKLRHLGFRAHVIGDVTTPPLGEGDVLVAISYSGQTSSVLTLVKKARSYGGRTVGVTATAGSPLNDLTDVCLAIPARHTQVKFPVFSLLGDEAHKNMSGALLGMNLFVFFYGVICELVARTHQSPVQIDARHANIE